MGEHTQTLSDSNFEDSVLKTNVPVLVDFWAEWCGPCRMIAPTVDAVAEAYQGRATVGKLNVDDNPATAAKFGIRSIPTLLVFKDGEIVDRIVGVADKSTLQAALDKTLPAAAKSA